MAQGLIEGCDNDFLRALMQALNVGAQFDRSAPCRRVGGRLGERPLAPAAAPARPDGPARQTVRPAGSALTHPQPVAQVGQFRTETPEPAVSRGRVGVGTIEVVEGLEGCCRSPVARDDLGSHVRLIASRPRAGVTTAKKRVNCYRSYSIICSFVLG